MTPSPSCTGSHDEQSPPCRACGFVPEWWGRKLDAAGTARDAPHVLAAFRTFAVVDAVRILEAFERAGRSAQMGLAAAYDLGGGDAALRYIRALALPGVKVRTWVEWDREDAKRARPKESV